MPNELVDTNESLRNPAGVIACLGTGFTEEPKSYFIQGPNESDNAVALRVNAQGLVRGIAAVIETIDRGPNATLVILGGNEDKDGIRFSVALQDELKLIFDIFKIQLPNIVLDTASLTTRQNAEQTRVAEIASRNNANNVLETVFAPVVKVDVVTSKSHNFGGRAMDLFKIFLRPGETVEFLAPGELKTVEDILANAGRSNKWNDLLHGIEPLLNNYYKAEKSLANKWYTLAATILYKLPFGIGQDYMEKKAVKDRG